MLYGYGLKLGGLDGYERLIAGIYGTPDRVPLIVQPYIYAMERAGLPARRFFSEPRAFVHASFNLAKWLGVDSWSPVFDFYNIELEALGQSLIWREKSEPDVDTRDPLIKDRDGPVSACARRWPAGTDACLSCWSRISATWRSCSCRPWPMPVPLSPWRCWRGATSTS